jgi:hypothetical protein
MDTLTVESASAIQQSKYANQVASEIAKKSLDVQKQQGQAAVALIQQAANIGQQLAAGHLDVVV